MSEQRYCISARNRRTGVTDDISGPMSLKEAQAYKQTAYTKKVYIYFRLAKYPFTAHKKFGR